MLEELDQQSKYSKFWSDLKGKERASQSSALGMYRVRLMDTSIKIEVMQLSSSHPRMKSYHCSNMGSAFVTTLSSFRQNQKVG